MIHLAGPYVDHVQRCSRCGVVLAEGYSFAEGTILTIERHLIGNVAIIGPSLGPPTCIPQTEHQNG